MIQLVKDTIDEKDIKSLIKWLETNPKLTKGPLTEEFEEKWSKWLGRKYSVFLNSGSSANLAMFWALVEKNKLKRGDNIIVPAVSWATTVMPVIQFGMNPILCEADKDTLGIDINHFEKLCIEHKPKAIIIVHVLGFVCKMKEIIEICKKYNVILLEDSCETVGSMYYGKKAGTFGLMSSFSSYFGHTFSTIEGGIVSTDDFETYEVLKSIRAHGWTRDLSDKTKRQMRDEFNSSQINNNVHIDSFKEKYAFYYNGFNLRPTDLNAKLGLDQLIKLDDMCAKRHNNLLIYDKLIKNDYWKINIKNFGFTVNFSYPIITPKVREIAKLLDENQIECRPLICGNMGRQPFFQNEIINGETSKQYIDKEKYFSENLSFSDDIHFNGMYLPNHHKLESTEIELVCDLVNSVLNN